MQSRAMKLRNIVTNSRVTPSWREIVSLTFSEAGVLHVNWTSLGHCVYNSRKEGHFIGECPKPNKNKAFVGGTRIDSKDGDEPQNDAICLIADDSQEILLKLLKEKHSFESEQSKLLNKINDLEREVKKLTKAKEVVEPCRQKLSQDKEGLVFSENEKTTSVHLTMFDPKSYEGVFLRYSKTSKAYIVLNMETMRIEESLNMTFNESLLEPKSSPIIEDDGIHEQVVQDPIRSLSLETNASEPGYPKIIKEARGHPIEQVIG
ncbi:hypothetical protein Tco_1078543 [Tanacetum coccineum]|uniref:Retroviral polymerase SH3-like domain-containing protein n=1 Tax=Tanacetum coccineum TaxID=301880 RepID=A0ABQ5HPG1_9ASTR